ncbi:hypothetical protein Q4560_07780 [Celeribacter halophilus]|uniref:Uncharacterized protein n=1 Tax=Celeribacter halophilus TaxID=576117 RepID=A0AAW7XRM5_9RHOB|nr:hypothetical protein [Celeribacter halophilus]MDO6456700.1 hypothetical protein [Celeribacter halophilus]MDO6723163.1 hypothetical protein [Celeribacter halophilus]
MWCWLSTNWLELLKAIGPTIIASIVAYVAWQQWQVNRTALREKLFDRRLRIYEQTRQLYVAMAEKRNCSDEDLRDFESALVASTFLYKKDVQDLLIRFREFAQHYQSANVQFTKDSYEINKLAESLDAEFLAIVTAIRPYLSFDNIRK